jgi:hypothetical protein
MPTRKNPHVQLPDEQFEQLAENIYQMMKLSAMRGMAHASNPSKYPLPKDTTSVEHIVSRFLKTRPEAKRKAATKRATRSLKQSRTKRSAGRQRVDLGGDESVYRQMKKRGATQGWITAEQLGLSAVQGAFEVAEGINDPIERKYQALGGEAGFLGTPLAQKWACPDGIGEYRGYEGGYIYWSPNTGAHEVHGAIHNRWYTMRREAGSLGYPTSDELVTDDYVGRCSHFEHGSIYWNPSINACEVAGDIEREWARQGGVLGDLGYPIGRGGGGDGASSYTSTQFQGGLVKFFENRKSADQYETTRGFTSLKVRIVKVKCHDESGPEWSGSDEIDLGGVAMVIDGSEPTMVDAFRVGSDFDDGESVTLSRVFHQFNLLEPGWPKTVAVTLALAEVDSGGFNAFLAGLLTTIREALVELISEVAATYLGAAVGAAVGMFAGPIGALIGVIAGMVVGALIDWIVGATGDEYFPVETYNLTLQDAWDNFSGYIRPPNWSHVTQRPDGDGHYQVWFNWELSR